MKNLYTYTDHKTGEVWKVLADNIEHADKLFVTLHKAMNLYQAPHIGCEITFNYSGG